MADSGTRLILEDEGMLSVFVFKNEYRKPVSESRFHDGERVKLRAFHEDYVLVGDRENPERWERDRDDDRALASELLPAFRAVYTPVLGEAIRAFRGKGDPASIHRLLVKWPELRQYFEE